MEAAIDPQGTEHRQIRLKAPVRSIGMLVGIASSLILRLAPALFGCWLASNAAAATLEGVTLPDTYTVDGKSLVLNGIGLRTLTFLHINAYVAGLFLPRPSHNAEQIMASSEPKVLVLKFMRSGSKERIEKQYRNGEQANCGDGSCDRSDQADFERLVAAAPAVEAGDTSTYIFTAKGVRVLANDRLIGDFANRDLAHLLLAGFIGKHPPSPQLRRQLLGLPDE
jgi:chalcone isomerase-like protein